MYHELVVFLSGYLDDKYRGVTWKSCTVHNWRYYTCTIVHLEQKSYAINNLFIFVQRLERDHCVAFQTGFSKNFPVFSTYFKQLQNAQLIFNFTMQHS